MCLFILQRVDKGEHDVNKQLNEIAHKYNINFYAIWGIEGGNGWIWFKQDDEMKFKVQVFIKGSFENYRNIKSDIVSLFLSHNCSLQNEVDLGANFGHRKNLFFIATEELQRQIEEKEKYLNKLQTSTYHIGQINADGGIVTLGNVINSTQSIDNSIKQIENQIEEKGGNEKDELYSTLNEAKVIIDEIYKTKEVKNQKSFIEKLTGHLSKHGWFYGAIITLFGTALIAVLKLGG